MEKLNCSKASLIRGISCLIWKPHSSVQFNSRRDWKRCCQVLWNSTPGFSKWWGRRQRLLDAKVLKTIKKWQWILWWCIGKMPIFGHYFLIALGHNRTVNVKKALLLEGFLHSQFIATEIQKCAGFFNSLWGVIPGIEINQRINNIEKVLFLICSGFWLIFLHWN